MAETDAAKIENYDWPCDLRIAHGPHYTAHVLCSGVPAHPCVMIGRS